jgi:hypothetical protein
MWKELIEHKEKWIGGLLIDYGDSMDKQMTKKEKIPAKTIITDMVLTDDTFKVVGVDFTCMGSREHLGMTDNPQFELPEGGLAFKGYDGHEWHIIKPKNKVT